MKQTSFAGQALWAGFRGEPAAPLRQETGGAARAVVRHRRPGRVRPVAGLAGPAVRALPQPAADALAGKLWLDEHFWTVVIELAAGSGLRTAGLQVAYEQEWDGLTPDWTVLSDTGQPQCFVEVHTDSPSRET
jgi:hypothetical protein